MMDLLFATTHRRFKVGTAAAAATVLCGLVAHAQSAPGPDSGQPTSQKSDGAPGQYAGVVPGRGNPPTVKAAPGAIPALVTWPGFQMLPNGGSRVFLQVTAPVELSTEIKPDKVLVTLKRTKVAGRNNRRALETRFFNTPVTRVALKRQKADTLVVLELRAQVAPQVTSEAAATGYHFVFFDFPAGNWKPAEKPEAGAEPVATELPSSPYPSIKGATATRAKARGTAGARLDGSASVRGSASFGAGAKSTTEPPLSEAELRALDEEEPPAVRTTVGGSLRLR